MLSCIMVKQAANGECWLSQIESGKGITPLFIRLSRIISIRDPTGLRKARTARKKERKQREKGHTPR